MFRTSLRSDLATSDLLHRCSTIRDSLIQAGLFAASPDGSDSPATEFDGSVRSWRIGTAPFLLTTEQLSFFQQLGPHLVAFYRALNRLYLESARGLQPRWIAGYLDQGKPEALIAYSRMKRFRADLPAVIRPDVIPTPDGLVITELDSVPGGIGLTAALSRAYSAVAHYSSNGSESAGHSSAPDALRLDPSMASGSRAWSKDMLTVPSLVEGRLTPSNEIVGGPEGMIRGFAAMLKHQRGPHAGCTAIVVSEEAKDYRPEMTWMAGEVSRQGMEAYCIEPRQVKFTEEGLRLVTAERELPIGLLYRFFELFDLPNIPKAELVQYAAKKEWIAVTPPYKPALEEKSAFAFLHHPALRPYWRQELGEESFLHLTSVMPRTWLLDPAPIPCIATIPGLSVGDRAVMNWGDLATATQKERHFVIKPSGFSELAWGSRGVSVGHDLPQQEWAAAIGHALSAFSRTPYVLQEFHKGRQYQLEYFDPLSGEMHEMSGRARLSPYYFVTGEGVELAGILATVCPADKKVIHGMRDAVMVPCAIANAG